MLWSICLEFFVYNGYNLLSLQMDMVMSQASETQLPMLKSSESWGGLHHPDVSKNSPGRFGLRSWQSEFFCDLLDGGEQIGGKYSLSSEFLVPRLSSWEHFGSWNRIAGTDAQLPVAFLGGTWWNNSWDSARKAYWCSFRSPQTCLELSRTTKNYMVAPLISEGTHQFKIVFMDEIPHLSHPSLPQSLTDSVENRLIRRLTKRWPTRIFWFVLKTPRIRMFSVSWWMKSQLPSI